MSEPERLRRLRLQDGVPLVPPADLQPLMLGGSGGFNPAKVDEAFHVYQATRREVTTTHSPVAAERLFFLTLVANTHLTKVGDHARRRALLETSLDTLTLARHTQVCRCLLACASAKEGDVPSAEQWLAPCNPRSDDLMADSAFRCARAFVDTVKRDYAKVVAVLGRSDDGYPIDDAWDPTAAVFRANALERLGDMAGAVQALQARMAREGHQGRSTMASLLETHRELSLCPASFAQANHQHSVVAAASAGRGADGGIGNIFFFVGLGVLALGLVLTVGIAGPIALAAWETGEGIAGVLMAAGLAAGTIVISTLPLGLIFAGLGWKLRSAAKMKAWLRVNGIQAQGVVRGHSPTGMSINDVPQISIQIEVHHPHHPPYSTSFKHLLTSEIASHLATGSRVPLRIHPEDPHEVLLELS